MQTFCWQKYFADADEGLGTTYERFILHNFFQSLRKKYDPKEVLEVPSFGMTGISGINSMWWAFNGIKVTIVDNNEERLNLITRLWNKISLKADFYYQTDFIPLSFKEKSFDMSWNFASLWFIQDLKSFFEELTRITRKVIFICIPNRLGLGYLARRVLNKQEFIPLRVENLNTRKIKKIISSLDWIVSEEGLFDVPPWPDIAMKKEDLLRRIGLGYLAERLERKDTATLSILDYYRGVDRDLETRILKYSFLENAPRFIKSFWAHHRYLIITPK